MMSGIYVFRDVLSGEYTYFGSFVNDAVAERAFRRSCNESGVPAHDLELYCASRLDSHTGRIFHVTDDVVLTEGPRFICRGVEDNVKVSD